MSEPGNGHSNYNVDPLSILYGHLGSFTIVIIPFSLYMPVSFTCILHGHYLYYSWECILPGHLDKQRWSMPKQWLFRKNIFVLVKDCMECNQSIAIEADSGYIMVNRCEISETLLTILIQSFPGTLCLMLIIKQGCGLLSLKVELHKWSA